MRHKFSFWAREGTPPLPPEIPWKRPCGSCSNHTRPWPLQETLTGKSLHSKLWGFSDPEFFGNDLAFTQCKNVIDGDDDS